MFPTLDEAKAWAESRWEDVYKLSYTDDAGDRLVLYPMAVVGEYETINLTDKLNDIVRVTEEYGGYDDELK